MSERFGIMRSINGAIEILFLSFLFIVLKPQGRSQNVALMLSD